MTPASVTELLEAHARKQLDDLAASVPKEIFLDAFVGVGTPWEAICRAANEHKADLIVIGRAQRTSSRWNG